MESYVIALAGKGGTGKTTVAGLVVRALGRAGRGPVLAVDADPNTCLDVAVGLKARRTVSDLLDETRGLRDVPANMPKPLYLEYHLEDCLVEGRGVDLIVMGRPEGAACYCSANQVLRTFLDRMIGSYPSVVVDNEAGMEHLSRRTTRDVDLLLVVSDATLTGARAARRIAELVRELALPVKRIVVAVNEAEAVADPVAEVLNSDGLTMAGFVPHDPLIVEMELAGRPVTALPDDAPAVRAVEAILERELAEARR
jgi:CO dehydrogenase maturation factor